MNRAYVVLTQHPHDKSAQGEFAGVLREENSAEVTDVTDWQINSTLQT